MTVKLIIKDEVNIKLENLPVDVRRKLVAKFKFIIPHARFSPAYKLGRWDGAISLFGLGGTGYISQLPRILEFLNQNGIEIEEVIDQRVPIDIKFSPVTSEYWGDRCWPEGHGAAGTPIRLRDYQVEAINNFLKQPQGVQILPTGAGKCQPYDAKIKVPGGWSTMGDIKPGDLVTVPDGSAVRVLEVFEPGMKDVYEITFSDGRKTRCCEDHLWKVHNTGWRYSKGEGVWRTLALKDVIELKNNTKNSIGIPLAPMGKDDIDVELGMDPWLMGFLLGDGCFRGEVSFSTADDELLNKVSTLLTADYAVNYKGNSDYRIVFVNDDVRNARRSEFARQCHTTNENTGTYHNYKKFLVENGLFNKMSHEKFIPPQYFSSSYNQRVELIRGLVDSDGTIANGSIVFTTTSKQLAEGLQYLVRSVGGIATVRSRVNQTYVYEGVRKKCKDSYIVRTKFKEPWNFVSLQRKKDATGYKYQYGPTLKLNISDIKRVSHEPVKCIMIDHPDHLYLTDDYIVTHNTIITATLANLCEPMGRTITIVPNKSLVEQTEEDFKNCGLDVGVYYGDRKELNKTHTISTWQSLGVLDKKSKDQITEAYTLAEFLEGVHSVIVDECHGVKAAVLSSLLTNNLNNAPIRWGLTGTLPKEEYEYESLFASIGGVIDVMYAHQLQDQGVLANCHINICQLIDYQVFKDYASEIKFLTRNEDRITYISKIIDKISNTGNTLVLVNYVETGKLLEQLLPGSVFISGTVKTKDRKTEYDEVKTSNDKTIIATYGVAAVGLNIVALHNVVLVEPGKSFVRVIQSIGRGLRKGDGKDHVEIWDIASTCKFSKRHLTQRKKFYNEAKYKFTLEKIDWN